MKIKITLNYDARDGSGIIVSESVEFMIQPSHAFFDEQTQVTFEEARRRLIKTMEEGDFNDGE